MCCAARRPTDGARRSRRREPPGRRTSQVPMTEGEAGWDVLASQRRADAGGPRDRHPRPHPERPRRGGPVRRAARRPFPRRAGEDARRHRPGQPGALVADAVPASIRSSAPLALEPGVSEPEVIAELRAAGGAQHGPDPDDRPGLPRHPHARRDPAQRAREPGLVHRVHALPGRDQPGPARGAAQLPDRRRRTSRGWTRPTPACSTNRPLLPRR